MDGWIPQKKDLSILYDILTCVDRLVSQVLNGFGSAWYFLKRNCFCLFKYRLCVCVCLLLYMCVMSEVENTSNREWMVCQQSSHLLSAYWYRPTCRRCWSLWRVTCLCLCSTSSFSRPRSRVMHLAAVRHGAVNRLVFSWLLSPYWLIQRSSCVCQWYDCSITSTGTVTKLTESVVILLRRHCCNLPASSCLPVCLSCS